ncbi:TetR/AcrR family transcriptional regulator [Tritonibacter litoralis]|uniref:TetR/AcrR family transcriptional regulator n=1 Tax=Tritonibacter litoralis TaxID=2662264 RepID=UPI001FE992CA|nr:TetR/AcrR family transcriptional regulator [Tritonibacter litoralis]
MSETPTALTARQKKKREEIIEIASEIFLREGFGRTSMDQIHARLGGSKRTLYSHFPKKEALFHTIVERISGRVFAALQPKPAEGAFERALFRMGYEYLSVLLSSEGIALYRIMTAEAHHFPELSRDFFVRGPAVASKGLARFFEANQTAGNLVTSDARTAAEQFLGAVRGDVHLSAVLAGEQPSQVVLEDKVACAVRLFAKRPGIEKASDSPTQL